MTKWLAGGGILVGILLTTSLASAQEPSKEAKIERILELTNGQATINQLFQQMKGALVAPIAAAIPASATPEQRQEIQSKLLDLMKSRFTVEKMRPAL